MTAKSLKCGVCGQLLANVREAQTHGELTGHSQFSETEEIIRVMKCTACGKPCRSDADRTLHTKFTGHTEYTEALANEGGMDTEQQMKEARDDMETDDDLVAKALAKKKAAAPPAGASTTPAATAATGDGAGADDASASTSGQEMVTPEVDAAVLAELQAMGFQLNRAMRAAYHTTGGGVEAAVNWIVEHEADADIDTPLLVTQASEANKLSPEESKRRALELMKAAKEKREKEERELAAHRERERIRAGKELAKAKAMEDSLALKRMVEQRKMEKEEEARAREKLRQKMEEDRKERRRRLGLPEELTEEEKALEAERAAAAAKEAEEKKKGAIFGHVKPVSVLDKLRSTLVEMKKSHSAEEDKWRTAGATLAKYIGNVAANPDEDKFRSIRTTNAAFQQRVAAVTGGKQFLLTCGFVEDGENLVLARDKLNMEVIQGAMGALHDLLNNQFFGML